MCAPGQVTRYAVSRNEDAEVTCSVQANPLQATFHWTFNNTADMIDVPQGRFTSSSSHSVITYTPIAALDYGTLLCWASNAIGTQQEPCIFHIVPAGKVLRGDAHTSTYSSTRHTVEQKDTSQQKLIHCRTYCFTSMPIAPVGSLGA